MLMRPTFSAFVITFFPLDRELLLCISVYRKIATSKRKGNKENIG